MATPEAESTTDAPATPAPAEPDGRGWRPYRLSVRQYLKMIVAGVFPPESHVELLGGILVEQMTKGAPHNYAVLSLSAALRSVMPPNRFVASEISLRLGPRSRPEPDVMVVQGPISRYKNMDVTLPDISLVVEVAESSYRYFYCNGWSGEPLRFRG